MIKRHSSDPKATPPAAPEAGDGRAKDPEINERIGRELRTMFEDVVAEPVPDKFRALLEQLERKSQKPES